MDKVGALIRFDMSCDEPEEDTDKEYRDEIVEDFEAYSEACRNERRNLDGRQESIY